MTTFNEAANKNFEKLDLFTAAITRAHGKNHPEAFEVRDLFSAINEKTHAAGSAKPDLDAEFTQLREITDNYVIPGDVCETYAAVYNMLLETDQAYQV
ncbi:iron-sulfur cluster repair di-iron protein, ric [Desemzia sp. FAM 24101]|uniref:iron-sulfur cluster repair di-iron protein, ric n=1 Tax=unclassified Desemzia TaxID=2685243 RepID=UPI00388903FD